MKNQNYYKSLYEVQLQQHILKLQEKEKNLKLSIEKIQAKISDLQAHLDGLNSSLLKIEEEKSSFPSFEEFFSRILDQSQTSKKKRDQSS